MTMAYHIYDPILRSWWLRFVTCNLRTWKLNACYGGRWMQLLRRKGWVHVFKGSWRIMHKQIGMMFGLCYGVRDPTFKIVDKEWTCFFHWNQYFDRHTKQLITLKFHDQHKTLCYKYKKSTSLKEVDIWYATIWSWWYSLGTINEGAIHELSTIGLVSTTFVMGRFHVGFKFFQSIMFNFYFPYVLPQF